VSVISLDRSIHISPSLVIPPGMPDSSGIDGTKLVSGCKIPGSPRGMTSEGDKVQVPVVFCMEISGYHLWRLDTDVIKPTLRTWTLQTSPASLTRYLIYRTKYILPTPTPTANIGSSPSGVGSDEWAGTGVLDWLRGACGLRGSGRLS